MSKSKQHELVILGAGPAGYRAAFMAADLGVDVTLIDPEDNPGGVCLYRGCIPSKALLHLAKIKKDAEHAKEMGLSFSSPDIDLKKIRSWKDGVVKKLTGGLGQLTKSRKINYIKAYAEFKDENNLKLKGEKLEEDEINFKNIIIATGAKAITLPGIALEDEKVMSSTEALDLEDIPEKLLIIGGGYIGLEMATIYQALGSKVSIVELTGNFMPGMDEDLIREYKKASKDLFEDIFFETRVNDIKTSGKSVKVNFKNKEKKDFNKQYDKILVAVGQKPNSENIGLKNTSVETDAKSFIKVDEKQKTSVSHIYAIGDVCGPPLLAHKGSYEGGIAAEVIADKKAINDAKAIPAVIYTEPEIATCGLSEKEAREKSYDYKVVKFPWSASGRAVAMNEKRGFTKLIINNKNERILGAGIVGKGAGDMIPEMVLAIEMAATAKDMELSIHPHPTLSETIMEAAELYYGHPTHTMKRK
jgi:dihydrolipoamide dehydrogenase